MFYDRFFDLCNQKGIKPSKAAEECQINKSNVSNWKNHGYVPRGDALNRIAAYFGVSTDYLLGNEQQKENPSGKTGGQEVTFDDFTYAMHDEAKELTDENKQKLLEMARFFKEQQNKKKNQ